ncbi:MAG TPA: lipoyl domain-containing protein [Candidatus Omnitrophota bacterium]|nr:lipoyl domain-containing protein [Candidatus Omnitrophota bacterium]
MNEIYLPELGEDIEKATIACWHKKVGERVKVDDDVVEVVTDKATFNVSAGGKGILKEIRFKEGEVAKVGDVLAVIEPTRT